MESDGKAYQLVLSVFRGKLFPLHLYTTLDSPCTRCVSECE